MSKIVKIKQKDIENIVKNIVSETMNNHEQMESDVDVPTPSDVENTFGSEYEVANIKPIKGYYLAKDENGDIYGIDGVTNEILFKK